MSETSPSPAAVYRDPGRAAAVATVVLACAFAAAATDFFLHLRIASLTDAVVHRPETVGYDDARTLDRLRGLAVRLSIGLILVTAAPFLFWFRRVWTNAESFTPGGLGSARGWVVGGWLVPVASLWVPRRLMGQALRGSALPDGTGRVPSALVNVWWGLWLGSTAGKFFLPLVLNGVFLSSAPPHADPAAVDAHGDAVTGLFADVCTMLAAAAAVLLIRGLTAQQRARTAAGDENGAGTGTGAGAGAGAGVAGGAGVGGGIGPGNAGGIGTAAGGSADVASEA